MHDRQAKNCRYPLPQFSLKILKKYLLKAWFTWLVYISLYFLPYLIFAEISSTWNSPRFNMSVIIFLISLLPSGCVKTSFSNILLVSETTFLFTAKISIALCWPISRDTKSFFTLLTLLVQFACNTRVIVDASSNPPVFNVKIAVTKTKQTLHHQTNKQTLHHQSINQMVTR